MPLLMCPNDNAAMQTVDRAGVQFDMCPTCRGVWLDRGELEKLMASAVSDAGAAAPPPQHQQPYAPPPQGRPHQPPPSQWGFGGEHGERGEYGERGERGYGQHGKRRGSIFDIFD